MQGKVLRLLQDIRKFLEIQPQPYLALAKELFDTSLGQNIGDFRVHVHDADIFVLQAWKRKEKASKLLRQTIPAHVTVEQIRSGNRYVTPTIALLLLDCRSRPASYRCDKKKTKETRGILELPRKY